MGMAEFERRRDEKVDGVLYDMSPSPSFRHGIINNNINTIIKAGLKNSLCLVFMENLDFKYHPEINDESSMIGRGVKNNDYSTYCQLV